MNKQNETKKEKVDEIPRNHKPILMGSKNTTEGITLIALVITIIVLLILAAVSIATLTRREWISYES